MEKEILQIVVDCPLLNPILTVLLGLDLTVMLDLDSSVIHGSGVVSGG
jgi:hypothetical protein